MRPTGIPSARDDPGRLPGAPLDWIAWTPVLLTLGVCFLSLYPYRRIAGMAEVTGPALIVGAAVAAAVIRPAWVVPVFLAYVPFSKRILGTFGVRSTGFNTTNLLMILVLVSLLLKERENLPCPATRRTWHGPWVLFLVAGLWSFAWPVMEYGPPYFSIVSLEFKRWLFPLLGYAIAYVYTRSREDARRLLVVMMLGALLVAALALKEFVDIGYRSSFLSRRVGGPFVQPNTMGAFISYYAFYILAFALVSLRPGVHWVLLAPFGVMTLALGATFSRGGMLGFFVGFLAFLSLRSRALLIVLLLAIGVVIAEPRLLPSYFQAQVDRTLSANDGGKEPVANDGAEFDQPVRIRLAVYRGALRMARDYPGGVGFGFFQTWIPDYAPEYGVRDAHNQYLLTMCEMGWIGFAALVLVLGWLSLRGYGVWRGASTPFARAVSAGYLAGMAGLLVSNVFGSRMMSEQLITYFWFFSGMIIRMWTTPAMFEPGEQGSADGSERTYVPLAGWVSSQAAEGRDA